MIRRISHSSVHRGRDISAARLPAICTISQLRRQCQMMAKPPASLPSASEKVQAETAV